MGKNQNTWSHRTKIIFREIKIIFHSLGNQSYRFLTGKRQRHSERITTCRRSLLLWMCFLNVWDNVPICLQAVFYMCFLGFIRYNKTFIACGFRKYENLFTHEYHIALKEYDTLGWIIFSHFPHQHAINVYYLLIFIY
jgi:hypothetical protein